MSLPDIDDLDIFRNIIYKLNDRDIIVAGAGEYGKNIINNLAKRNIKVDAIIDKNRSGLVYNDIKIETWDILDDYIEKPYIIVCMNYYEEIEELLIEKGYIKLIDYYYILHKPIIVNNVCNYFDAYNNKIIGKNDSKNLKVVFKGHNSVIRLGSDVDLESTIIEIGNDSIVDVGKNTKVKDSKIYVYKNSQFYMGSNIDSENTIIEIGNDSIANVGENTNIKDSKIYVYKNSQIYIGNSSIIIENSIIMNKESKFITGERLISKEKNRFNIYGKLKLGADIRINQNCYSNIMGECEISNRTTFGANLTIMCSYDSRIQIGEDCMFSLNIKLISGDAHCIVDLNNGEILNKYRSNLKMGNHVWIGLGCTIMYGTDISDGCIIGADSFLKNNKYNKNSIVAGRPAKILKENISWERKRPSKYLE